MSCVLANGIKHTNSTWTRREDRWGQVQIIKKKHTDTFSVPRDILLLSGSVSVLCRRVGDCARDTTHDAQALF